MAGLTKAQRAEKAAQAAQSIGAQSSSAHDEDDKPVLTDDGLITVTKGADELRIHPTCVKAHQSIGWQLKE